MGVTIFDFTGQVAVVTGAATGIGRRAAERFAESGAHLFLLDLDDAGGQAAADKITAAGGKADYLHCDLTQSADVMPTFERIAQAGRIDILVNSAGGFSQQLTIDETPEEEWDQVIARNLKSTFLTPERYLPAPLVQLITPHAQLTGKHCSRLAAMFQQAQCFEFELPGKSFAFHWTSPWGIVPFV